MTDRPVVCACVFVYVCLCSCAARSVFAPHIIRRPADSERWHRHADKEFVSFMLNTKYGMEVPRSLIEVDREKPATSRLTQKPDAAAMERTVRPCCFACCLMHLLVRRLASSSSLSKSPFCGVLDLI